MLSYRTAGESHGKAVLAIIEGFPAGVRADLKLVDTELARRQGGYGRGGRMKIEQDRVEVLSGVRRGTTLGSPIVLQIANRDCRIDDLKRTPPLFQPRPGHGDLAGAIKYLNLDMRNILERASARETAARVAAGSFVRSLLDEVGIDVFAYVISVGAVHCGPPAAGPKSWKRVRDKSPLYCLDPRAAREMMAAIDAARQAGDTLGGIFNITATGVPMGLGSHVSADRRLDGRLAAALMSIQAIKGVEIGLGFCAAQLPGSQVHDGILYHPATRHTSDLGYARASNFAGGIEAGMTNGQPIQLCAAMKPIATLGRPLPSIDIRTKRAARAGHERSDVCAVPAASVVGENAVAFELARALLEKTGGDTLAEVKANLANYLKMARQI
jgi:chorismate synthase